MGQGGPPAAGAREALLESATSRTFDIGIQAGVAPACYEGVVLQRRTVEAIARIRGQIQITLYAPRPE